MSIEKQLWNALPGGLEGIADAEILQGPQQVPVRFGVHFAQSDSVLSLFLEQSMARS